MLTFLPNLKSAYKRYAYKKRKTCSFLGFRAQATRVSYKPVSYKKNVYKNKEEYNRFLIIYHTFEVCPM